MPLQLTLQRAPYSSSEECSHQMRQLFRVLCSWTYCDGRLDRYVREGPRLVLKGYQRNSQICV